MPSRLLAAALACLLPFAAGAQTDQYRAADGRIFRGLPDTGGVVRIAERAFQRDPSLANALALGAAQSSVRWYGDAIETYTRAIRTWPDSATPYRWRGHRRLTLRNLIAARADLQTAAQLDSTLYGAWYHLGVVEFVDGDFPAAADAFRRAIPLAPDAGERTGSTDWLWQSLARSGRATAAESLLTARPDSIAVTNAYAARLRLYRGEIAPEELITPADTAGIQRATLAFGVGSWYLVQRDSVRARDWMRRAFAESDGWPAFGFIAAEGQLAGRTIDRTARRSGVRLLNSCVAALDPAGFTTTTVRLKLSFPLLTEDEARVARPSVLPLLERVAAAYRSSLGGSDSLVAGTDGRYHWNEVGGSLTLDFHPSGRVERSSSEELRASRELQAAIDSVLPGATWRVERRPVAPPRPVRAELWLSTSEADAGTPEPAAPAPAVFTLRMPATTPPRQAPGSPMPRFPEDLIRIATEGPVRFSFEIDERGGVVGASAREEWSLATPRPRGRRANELERFRAAVLDVLPSLRFRPATIGGCPVREYVTQPFAFKLGN